MGKDTKPIEKIRIWQMNDLIYNNRSFNKHVFNDAGIAQLVERNLAKVEVASSRLVSRSIFKNAANEYKCGNSSVGRAQPSQGWGREFETRFPLHNYFSMRTIAKN